MIKKILLTLLFQAAVFNGFAWPPDSYFEFLRAEKYYSEAALLIKNKKFNEAIEAYISAARSYEKCERYKKQVNAYNCAAQSAYLLRDINKALTLFKEAESITKFRLKDELALARIYSNISYCYRSNNDLDNMLLYLNKAWEAVRKENENHRVAGMILINFGDLYNLKGDYESAGQYYRKSLDLFIKIFGQNHPETAASYNALAVNYQKKGDLSNALLYFKKAADVYPLGKKENRLTILFNIGWCLYNSDKPDEALEYHFKALQIRNEIAYYKPENFAQSYEEIARCYGKKGEYKKQFEFLNKALQVREKFIHKNSGNIAETYKYLGVYFENINKPLKALNCYERGLSVLNQSGQMKSPKAATIYARLALLYLNLGKYEKALDGYQNAIIARVNSFNSDDITQNPSLEEAEISQYLINELDGKAKSLIKLAEQKTQAEKHLISALNACLTASDLIDEMRLEYTTASAKTDLIKEYKSVYENGIIAAYKLYTLTSKKKYAEAAFAFAEKKQSVLLRETLNLADAKTGAGIPEHLSIKESRFLSDLIYYKKILLDAEEKRDTVKINQIRTKYAEQKLQFDAFALDLEKEYPEYHRLKYNTATASLSDIQQKIRGKRTAFIEYFWGQDNLYAFLITENDVFLKMIKEPGQIKKTVLTLRKLLTKQPSAASAKNDWQQFSVNAYTLYEKLIKSILDTTLTQKTEKLIIVPDGILNYLPFEVLIENKIKSTGYDQLPYLIKRYALSYAVSGTLICRKSTTAQSKDNKKCLAFAPFAKNKTLQKQNNDGTLEVLRGADHADLPGSQREINAVAQYFEGDYYLSDAATEAVFKSKAKEYDILHLALHGEGDEENPLNSRLIFSKSENEDGILYAYELYNMKLNAELAVLSACQTGTGKFVEGEGIMSLARGFMYTGVPSVIFTLWNAPDNASAAVTRYFYQGLSENRSKTDAVRAAKLHYMETAGSRKAHPFYWAGFVLSGDAESLHLQDRTTTADNVMLVASFFIIILASIFTVLNVGRHEQLK